MAAARSSRCPLHRDQRSHRPGRSATGRCAEPSSPGSCAHSTAGAAHGLEKAQHGSRSTRSRSWAPTRNTRSPCRAAARPSRIRADARPRQLGTRSCAPPAGVP